MWDEDCGVGCFDDAPDVSIDAVHVAGFIVVGVAEMIGECVEDDEWGCVEGFGEFDELVRVVGVGEIEGFWDEAAVREAAVGVLEEPRFDDRAEVVFAFAGGEDDGALVDWLAVSGGWVWAGGADGHCDGCCEGSFAAA